MGGGEIYQGRCKPPHTSPESLGMSPSQVIVLAMVVIAIMLVLFMVANGAIKYASQKYLCTILFIV